MWNLSQNDIEFMHIKKHKCIHLNKLLREILDLLAKSIRAKSFSPKSDTEGLSSSAEASFSVMPRV